MPLPPLPPISPELEHDVFTHKGLHGLPASLREDKPGAPSNWERLAFLGDAVLQLNATAWLYSNRPSSRIGDLTVRRTQIVANKTLAIWSTQYDLPRRIISHPSTEFQLRNMSSDKIRGSLFEAYLGAVYLSGDEGLNNARMWIEGILQFEYDEGQFSSGSELSSSLRNMNIEAKTVATQDQIQATGLVESLRISPTSQAGQAVHSGSVSGQTGTASTPQELPKGYRNYLSAFNEKASQKGVSPVWEQGCTGPSHRLTWNVMLNVSGLSFKGSSSTVKEARNIAAKEAWDTLKWI